MRRVLKKISLLVIIISIFVSCTSLKDQTAKVSRKNITIPMIQTREETVNYVKNAVIPQEFQNQGAVQLINREDVKVDLNNIKTSHIFKIVKILNYEGKKKYSDMIINFDKKNEDLVLGDMYTITKEGTTVSIPKNQSIEQDDEVAIQSPQYVFNKNRIINFPNVEPGMSVVIDYKIVEKSDRKSSDIVLLDGNAPILKRILTLTYPKDLYAKYTFTGSDVLKTEKIVGDSKVVTFAKENSKPLNREQNAPNGFNLDRDKVVYTFYKNWDEIGARLSNLEKTPTKEIIALSNKIVGNEKDQNKKINLLYSYVVNNISLKRMYLDKASFKVNDLNKVVYQKFGNIFETNSLFLTLLKAQGIENAEPVIMLYGSERDSKYQKDYPMDYSISRIGVKLGDKIMYVGNPYVYMNSEDTSFNYISKSNNYNPTLYTPENMVKNNNTVKYILGEDKVTSKNRMTLKGKEDFNLRWYKNVTKKDRRSDFNQDVGTASGKLVDGPNFSDFNDYSKGMTVDYTMEYADFITTQGDYMYFNLLRFQGGLSTRLEKRNYDFQIGSIISKKQDLEFDLSKLKNITSSFEIVNNLNEEKTFTFQGKTATYKVTSEIQGKTLKVVKELYIPSGIVPKENYKEFKEFLLNIKNPVSNKVFIKTK